MRNLAAAALACTLAAPAAHGQGAAAPQEPAESQRDELSRRATDPTDSPPSVSFINDATFSYRDDAAGAPIDESGYDLRFQPVIPFKAWRQPNILRVTAPYQITGPGPEGLGDVTIFDLLIFPRSWGRFAAGAVGTFVPSAKEVPGHASGGPAIGFVARASKKLNVGLFNQNLFGTDTSISQIQPILAYQLGGGWSLSLGDLQFPYDWDRGEFLSLPIGFQIGKVQHVAGQPLRFSVNPQYDLQDVPAASRFKVLISVQLLLPERR